MQKFDKLIQIIKKLRAPGGCPWDREQTLESLKPHLLEETYEVLEAMDEGGEKLMGELGDLLLQVVVQAISDKMIRRHPHVFGDLSSIKTSDEVLVNWEKIKKQEKEHEDRISVLDGVPKGMPALLRAEKLQKKASKVGFDWSEVSGVIDKVEEEIDELRDEIVSGNKEKLKEELGDLFFALVNVSRHLGVNPEICLNEASDKFEKRFRFVEKKCDLKNSTLEEMDKAWEEAKK